MPEGQIVKALSGYYYVQQRGTEQIWETKARGLFRKKKIHPLVGDWVIFEPADDGEGMINEVMERKNELIRPPIANVDQALLVLSISEPPFSSLLLDRLLVHVERKGIAPLICMTKIDLQALTEPLRHLLLYYEQIGYETFVTSSMENQGLNEVRQHLTNQTTVVAGPSGAGKSTLLNHLYQNISLDTGEISTKLKRGKHTTRHVQLLPIPEGGRIADTPGFSQLDFHDLEPEQLGPLFPEIEANRADCKFRSCLHDREPHCAVKKAYEAREIIAHRYEHYLQFLAEIQQGKRY